MIIRGAHIVGRGVADIAVTGYRIRAVESSLVPNAGEQLIDAAGLLAFPGLVNSHDHLEFDVYPTLSHGPYADYVEWGNDIHRRDADLINEIERIPRAMRIQWGLARNLVCGITTVAHHGDMKDMPNDPPIDIIRSAQSIHSVRLERRWRARLAFGRGPVAVHIGEGTNVESAREIDTFLRWNVRRRPLIAVHGIAMKPAQAARFKALVWCPVSNRVLYEKTAEIAALKLRTAVLVGTDSTLSGDWNIWRHLRAARATGMMTDRELYDALTTRAAAVWGEGGAIAEGSSANIVLARSTGDDVWNGFFNIDPKDIKLVIHRGRAVLVDAALKCDIDGVTELHEVSIDGATKRCAIDIAALRRDILQRAPGAALPFGG